MSPLPQLRLLDDRVLVKVDEALDKTPGGIILPDSAKEKPMRGRVAGVGPGKFYPELCGRSYGTSVREGRLVLPLALGDVVLFPRYAGWPLPDHPDYMILRIDDVLAVAYESSPSEGITLPGE